MTRQRKMIELVLRDLREAATSADLIRYREHDEHKARIVLACAVDSALADLDHALSTAPCNHGACKGTTIELPPDGTCAGCDGTGIHARSGNSCVSCRTGLLHGGAS